MASGVEISTKKPWVKLADYLHPELDGPDASVVWSAMTHVHVPCTTPGPS